MSSNVEDLERVVGSVFDAARVVQQVGAPARWFIVRGHDADQRVVLETSRPLPHWWYHLDWPRRSGEDWAVPAFVVMLEREWVFDRWYEADPWFLAATYDGPVEDLIGRCFVDAATTDEIYAEAFAGRFRTLAPGETARMRRRREMWDSLSLPLRSALVAWDEGDDSVLAPDVTWWADQVLDGIGESEAKAKIRWTLGREG